MALCSINLHQNRGKEGKNGSQGHRLERLTFSAYDGMEDGDYFFFFFGFDKTNSDLFKKSE